MTDLHHPNRSRTAKAIPIDHPSHPRAQQQRAGLYRLGLAALLTLGAVVAWGEARAQTAAAPVNPPALTASDRLAPSVTDRREAAAAAIEGKRGNLDDKGQDYKANAMQRCARLTGDQRSDCESRVRGEGGVSGSVKGGGMIRSTETITIKPAPSTGGTTNLAPMPAPTPGATQTVPAAPAVQGSGR